MAGLAFWKANSKKTFAMPQPIKNKRGVICVDDDLYESDVPDTNAVGGKSGNLALTSGMSEAD